MEQTVKGTETTLRAHLEAIEAQTGITPDELHNPPPPPAVDYLLGYFYQLHLSRQHGMGANPILYSEMAAWQQLYHIPLAEWEIEAIKRLDFLYLMQQNEQ